MTYDFTHDNLLIRKEVQITREDIKSIRVSLGLTQGLFGSLLGVQNVTVCRWERGSLNPTSYQTALIRAFGRAARSHKQGKADLGALILDIGVVAVIGKLLNEALGDVANT